MSHIWQNHVCAYKLRHNWSNPPLSALSTSVCKRVMSHTNESCHISVKSHRFEIKYGVATTSRLLKIIGLFCKRALPKRLYSAKETYNFKKTTNRSHPILISASTRWLEARVGGGLNWGFLREEGWKRNVVVYVCVCDYIIYTDNIYFIYTHTYMYI